MKTFLVLFIIAASLPADAQRVRENIRQKVEIAQEKDGIRAKKIKSKAAQEIRKEGQSKKK